MTEDQNNSLKTWAEERDELTAILLPLRREKEALLKDCADLRAANTSVTLDIERKRGNLEIMEEYEQERSRLVSQELAGYIKDKTEQQLIIAGLDNQIATKRKELDQIETSLNNLVPVYERVTWQINQLTETIHKVVTVNSDNITEVNIMIADLRKLLQNAPVMAQAESVVDIKKEEKQKNTKELTPEAKVKAESFRKVVSRISSR